MMGDDVLQSAVGRPPTANWLPSSKFVIGCAGPQPEFFPRTSTGKVLRRPGGRAGRRASPGPAEGLRCCGIPPTSCLRLLRKLGAAQAGDHGRTTGWPEDLHLDSLAMVQLQSTLETEFGPWELEDHSLWGEVRTGGRSARVAGAA